MNLIRAGLLLTLLTAVAQAQEKTRVYINESQSSEMTGGIGGNRDRFSGNISGARPRTAKINKSFNKMFNVRCPYPTARTVLRGWGDSHVNPLPD